MARQVRGDRRLQRFHGGRLLVGGAPMRVLRVSERACRLIDGWLSGTPIGSDKAEQALADRLVTAGMAHPLPSPVETNAVTIVVPVRDDLAGLERLLASVGDQSVVVVDDGSREAVAAAIAARRSVTVLRNEQSEGPAAARERGLAAVTTPLVAFVDADVVVGDGWLATLVGHFADPSVAVVAPRVRSAPGTSTLAAYERAFSPLDLGDSPSLVGPGRAVPYVPSAALVARTEAIRAVGGFDPVLRFGEDVDLIWRLVAAGYVVRYDPSVEVQHRPRSTWWQWWTQRRHYGSAAAQLATRHGAAVAPARGSRLVLGGVMAAALGWPTSGLGLAAVAVSQTQRTLEPIVGDRDAAKYLAIDGHLRAARFFANAMTRAWWPAALGVAFVSHRARRGCATVGIAAALADALERDSEVNLAASSVIRLADNLAYGLGVWEGMLKERSLAAVVPDLSPRTSLTHRFRWAR